MRRLAGFVLALVLAAHMARAQQDSIFRDYADYGAFVDQMIATRDFEALILRLGGRDEYTAEDLQKTTAQLRRVWPLDFADKTVFRREDLGGGVSQEARAYWTGTQYAYFYALLHQRETDFVVLSFHLNTRSAKVMERF